MTDVTFTAACDAGPGELAYLWATWRHEPIEKQCQQAAAAWVAGFMHLDPAHCRFGPRRLVLVGRMTGTDALRAADRAAETLRWTLQIMYGHGKDQRTDQVPLRNVALSMREVKGVAPAVDAADRGPAHSPAESMSLKGASL